jgi:hypothetical protein
VVDRTVRVDVDHVPTGCHELLPTRRDGPLVGVGEVRQADIGDGRMSIRQLHGPAIMTNGTSVGQGRPALRPAWVRAPGAAGVSVLVEVGAPWAHDLA